jgi:hypothetical protein
MNKQSLSDIGSPTEEELQKEKTIKDLTEQIALLKESYRFA